MKRPWPITVNEIQSSNAAMISAAHDDVAVDGAGAIAGGDLARDGERQAGAGEEKERRGADVRDPAGQELRGGQRRAGVPHAVRRR